MLHKPDKLISYRHSAEFGGAEARDVGQRNCPPEDCGGPWGYAELLEILADPAHPQHGEQLEWVGGEFDPEEFSVDDTDAMLAAVFGRKEAPPS